MSEQNFRIGSLCSGARAGALDLAALELFPGSKVVWHCEYDDAPAKVLAHHWPNVPNHRDITTIDWSTLPAIDVLTAGYPCQPFSAAGQRKGVDDERHLWPYVREAIRVLRPRYTLLENVRGHLSLGFDRVLGDLAEDGLSAEWGVVSAASVGACHRRERLFILVTDAEGAGRYRRPGANAEPIKGGQRESRQDFDQPCAIAPDTPRNGRSRLDDSTRSAQARGGRQRQPGGSPGGAPAPVALLPTPSVADGMGGHLTRSGARSDELLLPGVAKAFGEGRLLPTPRTTDSHGAGEHGAGEHGAGGPDLRTAITAWGDYAPVIQRQERLSRPAPSPTEPNAKGNPRLAAAFAEWMQFWPAGWVTDPEIGLSRSEQLKCIGNGVVPRQAVAAFRHLLSLNLELEDA